MLEGLNSVEMGSKWAKHTCLSIPNCPGSLSGKRVFDPFLTHFWSQYGPRLKAFWDFPWAKTRHQGVKRGFKHLFEHPKWSVINFGKMRFLTLF